MSATIDILNPGKPKKVLAVASNPATSGQTGWPIGFWWAELTHPYWEFTQKGYHVDIVSPDGGALKADSWSDPDDPSGYSGDDLISQGFKHMPALMDQLAETPKMGDTDPVGYDALFLVGGQGPMYTFFNDERVHKYVADFYETGKVTCVICHATSILLKTRLSAGGLLVDGKTWTGYARAEEEYADGFAKRRLQPFRIQDEAEKLPNTNYIAVGRFREHAIRDGTLITAQQQYSGAAAARLVIETLGV
jgi:putative intracellular protease/amidase